MKRVGVGIPTPPALDLLPLVHASEEVARWIEHYWHKLNIPREAASRFAATDDREEFARWTGRRLKPLALGCYCYLPLAAAQPAAGKRQPASALVAASATQSAPAQTSTQASAVRLQPALPGFVVEEAAEADANAAQSGVLPLLSSPTASIVSSARAPASEFRHLIFIEPGLLPVSTEVTVAHELIHLRDRDRGQPRKHRCHGFDSISLDEAAITGHDPETLRQQLREETARREAVLRSLRPYRYIYTCPACGREYPRVRRYARAVSCGRCDKRFNLAFVLEMREVAPTAEIPVSAEISVS